MTAALQKCFAKHFIVLIEYLKLLLESIIPVVYIPMCGRIKEVNWVTTKTSLGDNWVITKISPSDN